MQDTPGRALLQPNGARAGHAPVLDALAKQGVLGGYDLSVDYPELGQAMLICATESRTAQDIETYVTRMRDVLARSRAA